MCRLQDSNASADKITVAYILAIVLILFSDDALARKAKPKAKPAPAPVRAAAPAPAPAAITPGTANVEEALKVKGQARNLSMMLMLKSREDQIKFIKIRKDFRKEILTTPY